ncbi:MAG: SMC-Scp complex subunit ScpB [Candidatus Omnitrophica bacterium]|nr:SMC-Scp complex subunit ScpB [Candidatus Omnitrophota bacterium]
MESNTVKSLIEAVLFSSDRPVLIEQIKEIFDNNISSQQIRQVLADLIREYIENKRGMRIVEVAGGFQMVTPEEFHPVLRKFFKNRRKERLSRAALETLAIIAYKQPVTKLQIESLRKVNVDRVIENLKEMGLIRTVGRRKAAGRPYLYGTTREFLEFFGLKSLYDLPKIENFSPDIFLKNNQKEKEDGIKETKAEDR